MILHFGKHPYKRNINYVRQPYYCYIKIDKNLIKLASYEFIPKLNCWARVQMTPLCTMCFLALRWRYYTFYLLTNVQFVHNIVYYTKSFKFCVTKITEIAQEIITSNVIISVISKVAVTVFNKYTVIIVLYASGFILCTYVTIWNTI